MTEQAINTAIVKSLLWGYKIPDPGKHDAYTAAKRPFDGFGITAAGVPLYYEAKLLKGYKALNFERIEPHQWKNLLAIQDSPEPKLCLVMVAIHKERGTDLYCFDVGFLNELRQTSKSIKKADFERYNKAGKVLSMYKGRFPLERIHSIIIDEVIE